MVPRKPLNALAAASGGPLVCTGEETWQPCDVLEDLSVQCPRLLDLQLADRQNNALGQAVKPHPVPAASLPRVADWLLPTAGEPKPQWQCHFLSGVLYVTFLGCGLMEGTNTLTISPEATE